MFILDSLVKKKGAKLQALFQIFPKLTVLTLASKLHKPMIITKPLSDPI